MQQQPDPSPALPAAIPRDLPRDFVHKINNQLTVVLAHAETSLSSKDPEEMKRALVAIVEATNSMASTVRAFAQMSALSNSVARSMQRSEGP
jgi:two-component sensor histidine kinase